MAEEDLNTAAVRVASFSNAQPGWDATFAEFAASQPAGSAPADPAELEVKADFASSGDAVNAILDGRPADVVLLADAIDLTELVDAGVVPPEWDNAVTGGHPVGSVVTMVVRTGNPRGVGDWSHLLQPGLEVVTPDPARVGSGRWALLAAYAAASGGDQDPEAGRDYLRRLILEHIALGPSTVRQATDEFLGGRGDVLLTSEAAALNMVGRGLPVELVRPPHTLRMDFPLAVTGSGFEKTSATELVRFVFSPRGQQLWAQAGFRPSTPVPDVEFPAPQRLWTVADLGGWDAVESRYFGANGFIAELFGLATQ